MKKDQIKIKADAFREKAGGQRTFATEFVPRKNCYSAQVHVGGGITRSVALYERVRLNCTMLEVPREIAQAWDGMGVDYKHRKATIPPAVMMSGGICIWMTRSRCPLGRNISRMRSSI